MSVTKGVEEGTFCLMNDIITETLGKERRCAYLSGPSFAREIMGGEATAVVIASEDDLAGELSKIISSSQFRCHTSRDIKVSPTHAHLTLVPTKISQCWFEILFFYSPRGWS
jgi:glycerol-3-phosphate dehydrogenase (NAD(P)+)